MRGGTRKGRGRKKAAAASRLAGSTNHPTIRGGGEDYIQNHYRFSLKHFVVITLT